MVYDPTRLFDYEYEGNKKLISITRLTPIQMPSIDIDALKKGRGQFTKEEWMDVMLRSIGMEADEFNDREKWLILTRLIPHY